MRVGGTTLRRGAAEQCFAANGHRRGVLGFASHLLRTSTAETAFGGRRGLRSSFSTTPPSTLSLVRGVPLDGRPFSQICMSESLPPC
jgi:hypothetical protein